MIQFKNVSKIYPPNIVGLKDVSLHIDAGEFVSVVGKSGTGKSTLAKLLFAEERVSKGKVVVGGWDITRVAKRNVPLLRRQIGVVFQDFKLFSQRTVAENVSFALEVCGAHPKRMKSIVPQVLKIVDLADKANRYPRHISGGEQQRVAIARALVHRPKILVADEPTGNLDTVTTREITDLLTKINEFGTTVVLVTHNRDVVNRIQRRVITLEDGRIVSDVKSGNYKL